MGGPCLCDGKAVSPGTDNFELVQFGMNGVTYFSAEQAYQAIKMRKEADRAKIGRVKPKTGEKGWDHGMRCWQAGQLGAARRDWEAVKVEAMYLANKCKLEQNPAVLSSLLKSNGSPKEPLTHMGSGKFWDKWNPMILMLLREELSPDGGDPNIIATLRGEMDSYRDSKRGRSILQDFGGPTASTVSAAAAVEATITSSTGAEGTAQGADNLSENAADLFEGNVLTLFRQADDTGDGRIDSRKLLSVFQRVDASWTEDRVDRLLESADVSTDASVHYEELISRIFLDACNRLSMEGSSEEA